MLINSQHFVKLWQGNNILLSVHWYQEALKSPPLKLNVTNTEIDQQIFPVADYHAGLILMHYLPCVQELTDFPYALGTPLKLHYISTFSV